MALYLDTYTSGSTTSGRWNSRPPRTTAPAGRSPSPAPAPPTPCTSAPGRTSRPPSTRPPSTWSSTSTHPRRLRAARHRLVSGCTSFEIAHQIDRASYAPTSPAKSPNIEVSRNTGLTPAEIANLCSSPRYELSPPTEPSTPPPAPRPPTQWKTACGRMVVYQGRLSVRKAARAAPPSPTDQAATPAPVLTLQKDGNLVIYPNTADATAEAGAVSATNASSNPADTLFLRPDGDLVIYGAYANVPGRPGPTS